MNQEMENLNYTYLDNFCLDTDGYKPSHYKQYVPGLLRMQGHVLARGGEYDAVQVLGLTGYCKNYLEGIRLTPAKIAKARNFIEGKKYGVPFNAEGWERMMYKYDGRLPLLVRGVPEGLEVPNGIPQATVENTDKEGFGWLPGYAETGLLRGIWYPSSVGTVSFNLKRVIKEYLEKTADNTRSLEFKLHDFGARGATSCESSAIGGAAHLANFQGTDTIAGALYANEVLGHTMSGFTIPAAEHSTITSWKLKNEFEAYANMLEQFPDGMVAVVSDSRNVYDACRNAWGGRFKNKILGRNGTLIVRPDSGTPWEIVPQLLDILGDCFGFTLNSKGFKMLPPQIRIIQGDGIDRMSAPRILKAVVAHLWSTENVTFGMGGGLLQKVDRDMQKYKLAACAVETFEESYGFSKDPITDPGKTSIPGFVEVYRRFSDPKTAVWEYDSFTSVTAYAPHYKERIENGWERMFKTYFKNGYTPPPADYYYLNTIRANANSCLDVKAVKGEGCRNLVA